MGIPYVQSRVVDGIIRSLRYATVYANDGSAQTLRELDANLTDAEVDAIVAGLDYGAGFGGNVLSMDDMYLMVDSDNQPAAGHKNYLRITRGMDTRPLVDPRKQLATVYFDSSSDTSTNVRVDMVLGADTVQLGSNGVNDTYSTGRLYIGGRRDNLGATNGYSVIEGGEQVLDGNEKGLVLRSGYGMEVRANPAVEFWYDTTGIKSGGYSGFIPIGTTVKLGGFVSGGTEPTLFIGDYTYGVTNTKALLITGSNSTEDFDIVLNTELGDKTIRFVPRNANYDMHLEVNAAATGSGADPGRSILSNFNPKFIVYSDLVNGSTNDAISAIRGLMNDYHGTMLLMRNQDTEQVASKSHFIRCQVEFTTPGVWIDQFTVLNNGNVCTHGDIEAHGSITPMGGCDVAEWIVVPDECESGNVIIMDTDGVYKKSTSVADAKVVGVIAEEPGINLGRSVEVENQYPLSVCGIVDVYCTTGGGDVVPGDLLVSADEGKAQKVGVEVVTGTVIGKALESVEQEGEEVETKVIKMLAMLQ